MSNPLQSTAKMVQDSAHRPTSGGARALARMQEDVSDLVSALIRARKRLSQRVCAVKRDLDRIDEAEAWTERGPWLVAAAARAPRGARSLEVSDWSSGEEQVLAFALDPSRAAREQVEAAFQRARRLRRGRPLAEERLREAARAVDAVDGLLPEVKELANSGNADANADANANEAGDSAPLARFEALRKRAIDALPHDVRGVIPGALPFSPVSRASRSKAGRELSGRGDPARKPPFRTFAARTGLRILVGRRADQNDELTFQVSRPYHLWLHAKDQSGAHVIAWNDKGKALTESELVDAACLAAHFSDARGEPVVDVTYTPRRYVRKPRRAPPGLVIADRAKVIPVRIDPALLKALLATEVEG